MDLALAQKSERYEVKSRIDLIGIFSTLVRTPIEIAVSIEQIHVAHTCFLVGINPAFEELVFDASGLSQAGKLDGSGGLSATVQINAVWFRFDAAGVIAVRGYDHPAFRARLPTVVWRMQRRNSIRYPVSMTNPPVCDVPTATSALRLRVIDISLSGVSLAIEGATSSYQLGQMLEKCFLHIPGVGSISSDLRVAYLNAGGKETERRIGCRFSNMLASSLTHLQRYITQLERQRLAQELESDSAVLSA